MKKTKPANLLDLIAKKKNGIPLTLNEINSLVSDYTLGIIPDYQMASFLMAVYFRGMDDIEILNYTKALMNSGDVIKFSKIKYRPVDKHSTGGVGDKVSIPLAALVAACGAPVPMISGRGLGHTGGTLDKLESIPGFNVNLSMEEFKSLVVKYGLALGGQTSTLVPADKKIYALRDVTETVDSIPLIVGSILSKKLAEGAQSFVFDVKAGSGAFMKDECQATVLAKALVSMTKQFKKKSVALVTDMSQPLGNTIGNSLEIIESIELLKGNGPDDTLELVIIMGAYMLLMSGVVKNRIEGERKIIKSIQDKTGLMKFGEIIKAQKGNPVVIDDYDLLPQAKYKKVLKASQSGYIEKIDALDVGLASVYLGAGRESLESIIDPAVGFWVHKKVGDKVTTNAPIITICYNDKSKMEKALIDLKKAITFSHKVIDSPQLIKSVIEDA